MKYPAVANYLDGSFVEDTLSALDGYSPSHGSVISRGLARRSRSAGGTSRIGRWG
jgi:hypothetical protein